jgi:hypothetical protein
LRKADPEGPGFRDRQRLPAGEGEKVGRGELDLETTTTGADVNRLETEGRLVNHRRQRLPLAERADAAGDVSRRPLRELRAIVTRLPSTLRSS